MMLFRVGGAVWTKRRGGFSVAIRRIAIAIAGCGVLAVGLVLIVVPVPGTSLVVIPLGLAILAREFLWAKRVLAWSRQMARAFWSSVGQHFRGRPLVLASIATPPIS